jgi:hypothetical protein
MVKIVCSVAINVVYQLFFYLQIISFIGSHFRLVDTACFLPNNLNEFGLRINSECLCGVNVLKLKNKNPQLCNFFFKFNNSF